MIAVREVTPSIAGRGGETLAAAFRSIWNAPANVPFLSFTLEPVDEDQIQSWLAEAAVGHVRYLTAEDEAGDVVGISVLRIDPGRLFEIAGVAVRPDAQGGGVGRLLVSRSLELAASLGHDAVEAAVFADNARMLRLLLGLGFVPVWIDARRRADGADLVFLKARLQSP